MSFVIADTRHLHRVALKETVNCGALVSWGKVPGAGLAQVRPETHTIASTRYEAGSPSHFQRR